MIRSHRIVEVIYCSGLVLITISVAPWSYAPVCKGSLSKRDCLGQCIKGRAHLYWRNAQYFQEMTRFSTNRIPRKHSDRLNHYTFLDFLLMWTWNNLVFNLFSLRKVLHKRTLSLSQNAFFLVRIKIALQCRHLIPALNTWVFRANTRRHARLSHNFLGMDALMTSQLKVALIRNVALICKLRGSLMHLAYFLTYHTWAFLQPGTGRRPVDWCGN